ncbi:MAG: nucleotidyltransferase family protein [Firmicutes bacterium]|nr:nucleotidyltransferase family protein [Bacillota bacterium]
MKTIGIVAEFNPFHEGHKYLIEQAKKDTDADICVVVMSGNFVQRGMPAVFDKWKRAEAAVKQGVNLVVELPAVYAVNSAEYFAKGAIEVLEGLGGVDILAFGSEAGDLDALRSAAAFLKVSDDLLKDRIQLLMREGYSHPKAREIAVLEAEHDFDDRLIKEPNNILGIEYLKQIETLQPYTVKRQGKGYHASASEIRARMEEEQPGRSREIADIFYRMAAMKILQMPIEELTRYFAADAGLANKLKKEIRYADSLETLIDRVKSKVYTRTRICRLLAHILLEIREEDVTQAVSYARVLAFDGNGAKFLKDIRKREVNTIPVITNINKEAGRYPEIRGTLEKDILASDIYNLLTGENLYEMADYTQRPYINQ